MRVVDIMATEVQFLAPDASVQEAATLMGELDVGALPVGSPSDLQGVVTDRDILYRVVAEGQSSQTRVRDVMSRTVFACLDTDDVATAMDMMGAYHIRRLPVRNAEGSVVGWVTLTDISKRLLEESGAVRQALQTVSGVT